MREFPNSTPRPWDAIRELAPDTDHYSQSIYEEGSKGLLIGRISQNGAHDEDAALIVHAVNTYEERERLLNEAELALRLALEYWASRQQRYRNRGPVWVEAARAIIAKLEVRDA